MNGRKHTEEDTTGILRRVALKLSAAGAPKPLAPPQSGISMPYAACSCTLGGCNSPLVPPPQQYTPRNGNGKLQQLLLFES